MIRLVLILGPSACVIAGTPLPLTLLSSSPGIAHRVDLYQGSRGLVLKRGVGGPGIAYEVVLTWSLAQLSISEDDE
eukprot:3936541-Rhodomonas_salina.1